MEASLIRAKKYTAPTLRQAMDAMRKELGDNALLLTTRSGVDHDGTPYAEVIGLAQSHHASNPLIEYAAGEPSFRRNYTKQRSEPIPLQYYLDQPHQGNRATISKLESDIDRISTKLVELTYAMTYRFSHILPNPYRLLYTLLRDAGFNEEITAFLISRVSEVSPHTTLDDCLESLRTVINTLIRIDRPLEHGLPPAIAFSGPSGSGKTTTLMKTAILLQRSNPSHTLRIVGADAERMGAIEQLRAFTTMLNLPLDVIRTNEDIHTVAPEQSGTVVLFDLPPITSRTRSLVEATLQRVRATGGLVFITIPSSFDGEQMRRILSNYTNHIGYRVALTKLDETSSYGHILPILWENQIPLSLITTGRRLPDDIVEPTIDYLMQLIVPDNRSKLFT